jgi:hypothetical protein
MAYTLGVVVVLGVMTVLNQERVFPIKTKKVVVEHKTQMVIIRILHGALEIAIIIIALNTREGNVLSIRTKHIRKST